MPEYLYRREDGSTFTIRQHFSEDALSIDPDTGQKVVRVVQPAGIIFKGSGFYVNDSRNASKSSLSSPSPSSNGHGSNGSGGNGHDSNGSSSESTSETKSEAKKETATSTVTD
jgi:predicted nucleic acid-binding Zn ribbon protein